MGSIFKEYVDRLLPLVPTIWRRKADNILNLALGQYYAGMDAVGQALTEYSDVSWPLTTASGWLLDQHWGPYTDIQRNGASDDLFRKFVRAKRLLNRSWGAADQALRIFRLLLPDAAILTFTPSYPKYWVINIAGVDMVEAAQAIAFMTKKPSPQGGGFSVCGDNGQAVISDAKVLSFSSVVEPPGINYEITGWFDSVHGAVTDPAGWAHAVVI